jgi:GAF domain-containing protein
MMFRLQQDQDVEKQYQLMTETVKGMLEGESDVIAALSNVSAVLNSYLEGINWVVFYLLKGKELVLGPFQGLPACSHIGEGRGVCGRAVLEAKPIIVPDVHVFSGHIACDSNSASEIVLPLFKDRKVFGVLDVDSPQLDRFSALEAEYLGRVCGLISDYLSGVPHNTDH